MGCLGQFCSFRGHHVSEWSLHCVVQGCMKTLGHQTDKVVPGWMFQGLPLKRLPTEGDLPGGAGVCCALKGGLRVHEALRRTGGTVGKQCSGDSYKDRGPESKERYVLPASAGCLHPYLENMKCEHGFLLWCVSCSWFFMYSVWTSASFTTLAYSFSLWSHFYNIFDSRRKQVHGKPHAAM